MTAFPCWVKSVQDLDVTEPTRGLTIKAILYTVGAWTSAACFLAYKDVQRARLVVAI